MNLGALSGAFFFFLSTDITSKGMITVFGFENVDFALKGKSSRMFHGRQLKYKLAQMQSWEVEM